LRTRSRAGVVAIVIACNSVMRSALHCYIGTDLISEIVTSLHPAGQSIERPGRAQRTGDAQLLVDSDRLQRLICQHSQWARKVTDDSPAPCSHLSPRSPKYTFHTAE
jgi:hypothetical protein